MNRKLKVEWTKLLLQSVFSPSFTLLITYTVCHQKIPRGQADNFCLLGENMNFIVHILGCDTAQGLHVTPPYVACHTELQVMSASYVCILLEASGSFT